MFPPWADPGANCRPLPRARAPAAGYSFALMLDDETFKETQLYLPAERVLLSRIMPNCYLVKTAHIFPFRIFLEPHVFQQRVFPGSQGSQIELLIEPVKFPWQHRFYADRSVFYA